MPDVLEPGEEVVITVSEQSKRKMTYYPGNGGRGTVGPYPF